MSAVVPLTNSQTFAPFRGLITEILKETSHNLQIASFSLPPTSPRFVCTRAELDFSHRDVTSLRTPRVATAGGMDTIMQQAQNLRALQQGQTPLVGGENPDLHDSDFSGITPRPSTAATPHPMVGMTPTGGATGRRNVIAGISSTPMLGATPSVAGTPMRTPGELV